LRLGREVTRRGIEYVARLKKLEKFYFTIDDSSGAYARRGELYPVAVKRMPYLRVVGCEHGDFIDDPKLLDFDRVFYDKPVNLDICGSFMLEELFAMETLPLKATFPNLRALFFWNQLTTRRSIDILASSTDLNLLAFVKTPFRHIVFFLQVVGATLKTLYVENVPDQADLAEVFFFCPHLRELRLSTYPNSVLDTELWPSIKSHNFSLLKSCEIFF
jgi:hypothetical protein